MSSSPPPYARPQKGSGRGVIAGLGCGMLLVILLIVVVCGALSVGGYLLLRNLASTASSLSHTSSTSGDNALHSNTPTPTSIPTRTFPINGTLTYASITITVVNAQLAASFPEDLSPTNGAAILRLSLKEKNPLNGSPLYSYHDVARLILPDQSSVAPSNLQYGGSPSPNSDRTNWLDFEVPATLDVSRTILRLGTSSEAQMDIPLQEKPNLSKYQPRTTSFTNARTTYAGMQWTVTAATVSWSDNGQQAGSGKRFLTLSFRVDNQSQRDIGFNPVDFMRLQVGSDRFPPVRNTLATTAKAQTTNYTGEVIFIIPEGTTSCTVIMMRNELVPNSNDTQIALQLS
ncbi:hypothetical protein [Thermogemmatispora sp.]|uniref:hypothetical protein n=1 Tax=Thermogemmatispora sp. TaxID=1968838 RepID=UPI00262BEB60|nr:hypothetical protein [Thermogemmatispora sp.]